MDEKQELIARIERTEREIRRLEPSSGRDPWLSLDLTMQQLKTLLLLSRSDGLPSGELARGLGVRQPNVTGIVDRLIGQRLVAREPDSQDRRVIRVVLSDEGRALVENLQQAGQERRTRVLVRMDASALRNYEQAMRDLVAAMSAERDEVERDGE